MKKILLTLALFAVGTFAVQAQLTYTNPVINEDAPDPSVILGDDGYYYLHSTAEHVYRSTDLVNWKYVRQAFGSNPRTLVEPYGVYWAPCITKQGDKYVLYFALSKWGEGDNAMIGVATSSSAGGPFRLAGNDGGKLFTSKEVGVSNSIDPFYFEDNGKKYIVWGSWNKIWAIELTEDGLAVKNMNVKHELAGTRFEAPYIYKRNGYYYMFASIDACCEGARSTYKTVVGRSTSFLGEYKTKNGSSMKNNAFDIVLQTDGGFIAPGHNSRIIEDESGKTWMLFHAYDKNNVDKGRTVCLDEVKWTDDGWPYFENKGASWTEQPAPDLPYIDDDGIRYLKPRVTEHQWGTQFGTIVPADLDNNGRCELIIGAYNHHGTEEPRYNAILKTDGAGNWQETTCELNIADRPAIVPCDINGDGNIDLVAFETLGGDGMSSAQQQLFNSRSTTEGILAGNGDGTFRQLNIELVNPEEGLPQNFVQPIDDIRKCYTAAVADFNRDGWPDIVAIGQHENNAVLLNCGFSDDGQTIRLKPIYFDNGIVDPDTENFDGPNFDLAIVQTADFNRDGWPDIVVSANNPDRQSTSPYWERYTEVYLNDGTGTAFRKTQFAKDKSRQSGQNPSVANGALNVADLNSDGRPDLFLQGLGGYFANSYWDHTFISYCGSTASFTSPATTTFDRLILQNQNSTPTGAALFDWDADGHIDIIYQGFSPTDDTQTGYIWRNAISGAGGKFGRIMRWAGGSEAATCITDWNGDGTKDIVSTGWNTDPTFLSDEQQGRTLTVTYNGNPAAIKLGRPLNLSTEVEGNKVTLSWEAPASATKTTTYEVYVKDAAGHILGNCRAFTSGAKNGTRKVEDYGNNGANTTATFILPAGTYSWGVQSINSQLIGSPFATGRFEIIETGIEGVSLMNDEEGIMNNSSFTNHYSSGQGPHTIYDLQGRKVASLMNSEERTMNNSLFTNHYSSGQRPNPGIYIVGGKKVVVK